MLHAMHVHAHKQMNIMPCIYHAHALTLPSAALLLSAFCDRRSLRLRLLAAKKKIGLTCKPGQEPRAAQAGLRCHLRGERSPFTATPEVTA